MSKEIIVIGGGIIGLCSAYYLAKEGHKVKIVDQSNMDGGASYVNAGYLSPSHLTPLSAPGVMKKGLRWMFNSSSPLYIKPRVDIEFLKWTWAFNRSCNPKHVERAAPIIRDICISSQHLYQEIMEVEVFKSHYETKGLMMVYKTEKGMKAEVAAARLANNLDIETKILDREGIKELQPNAEVDALGAVYYKCDHHSTPTEFMEELKANLIDKGVEIFKNEKVQNFSIRDGKIISIETTKQTLKADEFVMATGAWSSDWNQKLGLNLLMQAGKGYRINSYRESGISIPAILSEAKAAITPMNGFTRFAGTMELAGINTNINAVRVEAIANAINRYFPNITITEEEKRNASCGLRPVTPDGLPYIGRFSKYKNLTVAAGHAMMGWSMATATGLMLCQIIDDKKTLMPTDAFNPERKF